MNSTGKEIWYVVLATAGAILLHRLTSIFPFVFVLPAVIAYTIMSPLFYLVLILLAIELMATTPGGIMTAVVLLPFLTSRLFRKVTVDLSIPFFGLVAITILGQFIILFIPEMWSAWQAHTWSLTSLGAAVTVMPWRITPILIWPILLVYGVAIFVHFNRRWSL